MVQGEPDEGSTSRVVEQRDTLAGEPRDELQVLHLIGHRLDARVDRGVVTLRGTTETGDLAIEPRQRRPAGRDLEPQEPAGGRDVA